MRTQLLVPFVTILSSTVLCADSYKDDLSGLEFPESIGAYKRAKATPYKAEPGKDGVAIEYSSDDAAVSVYVRAASAESMTSEAYLKASLAGVKALEAKGEYSKVKIYALSADKERAGWKSAVFTSSSSERFLISFIHCKGGPKYLVKIRATTSNPKNEELQAFIKAAQELVDKDPKKP